MNAKRLLTYALGFKHWAAFQYDTRFPEKAQLRVWQAIQTEMENGSFWKNRLGKNPQDMPLKDFAITGYEDYRPTIEADYNSKTSSLSGRPLEYWVESSGTTGGRKLFPLTKQYYKSRLKFNAINNILHLNRNPNLLKKRVLFFGSPSRKQFSPTGIGVGLASNYHLRPDAGPQTKMITAIPLEIYRDLDTFLKWAPLYAIADDISMITGMAAARVEIFMKDLANRLPELMPYLKGEKPLPADLPPIKVSEERIATISKVLKSTPFLFRDLWPSFRVISLWKSSTCALQLPLLKPYLRPEDIVCDTQYTSSEGLFSIPVGNNVGGPCAVGLLILEFVNVNDPVDVKNLKSCWELEVGQDYELFVTNLMGLVRYRMQDIVRCIGYYNKTATIEFIRKSSGQLSLGGGAAIIDEALIVESISEAGIAIPGNWMIGITAKGNGLVLYYSGKQQDVVNTQKIDEQLSKRNITYRGSLKLGTLVPLRPIFAPPDHKIWELQKNHAQAKPKILTTEIFADITPG